MRYVTPEVIEKVGMIRQLSGQIAEMLASCERDEKGLLKFTWSKALMIQKLKLRRAELRATLPPLKVIAGTTVDSQENVT